MNIILSSFAKTIPTVYAIRAHRNGRRLSVIIVVTTERLLENNVRYQIKEVIDEFFTLQGTEKKPRHVSFWAQKIESLRENADQRVERKRKISPTHRRHDYLMIRFYVLTRRGGSCNNIIISRRYFAVRVIPCTLGVRRKVPNVLCLL